MSDPEIGKDWPTKRSDDSFLPPRAGSRRNFSIIGRRSCGRAPIISNTMDRIIGLGGGTQFLPTIIKL